MNDWEHSHVFETDATTEGERRTRWVVALTAAMMGVEVAAGMVYGSMALLADGWHMATHAAALGIALFAYAYARKHAADPRYSFGTGKVGALGGFASAAALAVVALTVLGESLVRLFAPRPIAYDESILVAAVGLGINLVSALALWRGAHHDGPAHAAHEHEHQDHNLRGAYLHVVADALTSVLAIVALVIGKLVGWTWIDPAMGIAGSLLIARWSYGLLRETSGALLDAEASMELRARIRAALEEGGQDRVADLHLWRVGPAHLAAIVSVVSPTPRDPAYYRSQLASFHDLAHVTVEVHADADGSQATTSQRSS